MPGLLPGKSVRRGRAFRAGSCPREKARPSLVSPATRPCRPRLTAAQGPRVKQRAPARRSNSHSHSHSGASRACRLSPSPACRGGGSCFCAPGARCSTRGPYGAAGGWRKVRRMAGRDAGQLFAGTGGAVEKPRSPPAHPDGRMPGGRAIGVASLLVTFLWPRREKQLGPRQRLETALKFANEPGNRRLLQGETNRVTAIPHESRPPRHLAAGAVCR